MAGIKALTPITARAVDALAIATFSGMFACVIAQVVFRYFLASPLTWSDELARYLFVYRDFDWRDLPRIILDTVETTVVVMALVMTAALLGYCISVSRLPQEFGATLTQLARNPLVYLLIVNVLLVVGCFMEALSAMLVLIPILVPTAIAFGIDPVQFGLVFVLNLMIGTITPPVGVVLYVTAKVANVSFDRMARAVVPYLIPLGIVLALITLWPALTTFVPRLVLGQ